MSTETNTPNLTPDALLERFQRSELLFTMGDFRGAATAIEPVVEQEPEHDAARLLLARAYFHSAQLARAEEHARVLVAKDPSDAYAHLVLGRVLERQSRQDEAGAHLRLAEAMGQQL